MELNRTERGTTTTTTSTKKSTTTTTSSSTTTTQEETHIPVVMETLLSMYREAIGRNAPSMVVEEITYHLCMVCDWQPDWVEYALQETAYAPMPSWRYAQAIIRRLSSSGDQQPNRRPATRQPRVLREQAYTQREYQDSEEMPAWMVKAWEQMQRKEVKP